MGPVEVEADVRPLNRGSRIFSEGSLGLVSGSILTWTVEVDFPTFGPGLALGGFGMASLEAAALAFAMAAFFAAAVLGFAALTGSNEGERLSDVESSDSSIFTRFTGMVFLVLRLLPFAAFGGGDGAREVDATGVKESVIVISSTCKGLSGLRNGVTDVNG